MPVETLDVFVQHIPLLLCPGVRMVIVINHFVDALQEQIHIARVYFQLQISHAAFCTISGNKEMTLDRVEDPMFPERLGIFTEQMIAEAMDGADVHALGLLLCICAERLFDAVFHGCSSLLRKCESHNIFRPYIRLTLQNIGDPAGDDLRFAGAGAGNNLQIAVDLVDRLLLLGSQG